MRRLREEPKVDGTHRLGGVAQQVQHPPKGGRRRSRGTPRAALGGPRRLSGSGENTGDRVAASRHPPAIDLRQRGAILKRI